MCVFGMDFVIPEGIVSIILSRDRVFQTVARETSEKNVEEWDIGLNKFGV